MKLRAAEEAELSTVLGWLPDEQTLRMWAGPAVRYPASPESAWSDMSASADNTYVYLSSEGTIIGFGQILLQDDNSAHLARLIVNPKLRGQGVGRSLCVALIKMGAAKHAPKAFTLNVYQSNKTAIGLYRSLGFTVQSHGEEGIVTMVKALRSSPA